MQTKMKWNSIANVFICLGMITLIFTTTACRKNNSDPTPDPGTPDSLGITDPFSHEDYKFLTDDEIAGNKKFGGSLLYNVGVGISNATGANVLPEIPFTDGIDVIWEIYNFNKTQANFSTIDNQLGQLSTQISDLQNELVGIANSLKLTQVNILNKIDQLSGTVMNNIELAFDSSSTTGLRYFSQNAAKIQKGQSTQTIQDLQAWAQINFVNRYTVNPVDEADMQKQILLLNSAIIGGNTSNFQTSVLKDFADNIILNQSNNAATRVDTNAMNCYKLLENYFLMMVNSQYKGLLVYGNAVLVKDTTSGGRTALQTFQDKFKAEIVQELNMFLTVVDYLSVNLVEFRTENRFRSDMNYLNFGIKYDGVCGPFISRANLLNSMILQAIGAPTKDFYITIALPQKYCSSTALSWSFDMDSYPLVQDNNGIMKSQYPYTYWNGSTSSPDNIISFYRGNGGNSSKSSTLKYADVGIANSPWYKKAGVSMHAQVPLCWVNPNDPTKTSSTYSKTYCLAFGSASLYWPWGYMFLNDQKNMQNCQNFFANPFDMYLQLVNLPYVADWDLSNNFNVHSEYNKYFTWDDYNIGYNGPETTWKSQSFTINYREANIKVDPNPNSGNGMAVISRYATDPPNITKDAYIWFSGGTFLPNSKPGEPLHADLFSIEGFAPSNGTSLVEISSGSKTMNYGFCLQNDKPAGVTHEWNLNYFSQVIYWGTYNIWN